MNTDQPWSELFDRVCVINLDSETERLRRFQEQLPDDWPFCRPERFPATNGNLVPPPHWWRAGPAAWGCFRSHCRVLEDALNDRVQSLLVFEDDAVLVNAFTQRVTRFFEAVPDDWNWVYLGGQHIEQEWGLPTRVNAHVYRPHNVHRSHAYALRGRRAIEYLYTHLNTPSAWRWGTHLDHRIGELHKNFPGGVYVPSRWLVGQREGFSSIKKKELPTNFFVDAQTLVDAPVLLPMVAVVGENDRARRLIAAALHHLGLTMGETIPAAETLDDFVTAVSPGLDGGCRSFFTEPRWDALTSHEFQVSQLRIWASKRGRINEGQRSLLGGSHQLLGLIPESLCEAWNRPKVIRVLGNSAETSPSGDALLKLQKLRAGLSRFDNVGFAEIIDLDPSRFQSAEALIRFGCDQLGLFPTVVGTAHSHRALASLWDG